MLAVAVEVAPDVVTQARRLIQPRIYRPVELARSQLDDPALAIGRIGIAVSLRRACGGISRTERVRRAGRGISEQHLVVQARYQTRKLVVALLYGSRRVRVVTGDGCLENLVTIEVLVVVEVTPQLDGDTVDPLLVGILYSVSVLVEPDVIAERRRPDLNENRLARCVAIVLYAIAVVIRKRRQ